MPPKKRKISDLTANDANTLLLALNDVQAALDEDDKGLPSGLIAVLDQFRTQLEVVKHVPFSKVDAIVLLEVNIKPGPLFLVPEKRALAEERGSAEIKGKALSMEVLKNLIELVRLHVAVVTEAGCRVLINIILLRVASAMSTDQMDVNIIPEYPISKTLFPAIALSKGLLTSCFLLRNPTIALRNPDTIKGPVTSTIFEAKRDNVHAALPQAVMAAASHCKQHGIQVLRGCVTSGEQWIFFVFSMTEGGGGFVSYSDEYNVGTQFEGLPLILGLLHDWVDNAADPEQLFFTYE